nr:hypothetical protein CFP56_20543 [Quercus suber]
MACEGRANPVLLLTTIVLTLSHSKRLVCSRMRFSDRRPNTRIRSRTRFGERGVPALHSSGELAGCCYFFNFFNFLSRNGALRLFRGIIHRASEPASMEFLGGLWVTLGSGRMHANRLDPARNGGMSMHADENTYMRDVAVYEYDERKWRMEDDDGRRRWIRWA